MASILKVNTFTGASTAGSIAVTGEGNSTTTNLQQGLCKGWCNFDGTGTAAFRDTFNFASLTDQGTGQYDLNFTNNMANTSYSTIGSAKESTGETHSSAGAVDVENAKYIRITNLSTSDDMILAFVTSGTNYQVTVRAGGSHILYQAEDAILGEADSTPAFSGLADVVTIQARPSSTTDVQCELFIALV